jgi:hypothetical protein
VRVRASSRVSPKAIVEEPAAVEPGIDILAFDTLANRTVRQTNTDERLPQKAHGRTGSSADRRGLVDRRGKERYLLALRVRASARLERWLAKLESAMNRDWREAEVPELKREHYLRELQRIALGQDPTATAHDRLGALRELLRLGPEPSHLAAVQVLLKEGEVEGVEPDEEVDAREPGGETDNPGHPAHS